MKSFVDPAGNEYWVSSGLGGGAPYRTLKQEPRSQLPRVVNSRLLPYRQTEARAQADLDKYAAGCQMRQV